MRRMMNPAIDALSAHDAPASMRQMTQGVIGGGAHARGNFAIFSKKGKR